MKNLFTLSLLILFSNFSFGQSASDDGFYKTSAINELIGETDSTNLLFVGDLVAIDSVINSPVKDLWTLLDGKVDYVIVFSEEMKQAVSSVSKSKVILTTGSYEDYFVKAFSSLKKWFWCEYKNGRDGSFTASKDAYDLVYDSE